MVSFCDPLKPRLQSSKPWARYCINIVLKQCPRVQQLFSRQPKQQKATFVPTRAPFRETGVASGPHKHTTHCTSFVCTQCTGTPVALNEPQVLTPVSLQPSLGIAESRCLCQDGALILRNNSVKWSFKGPNWKYLSLNKCRERRKGALPPMYSIDL